MEDTIFALSSGQPPAAIAIIRISGSRAGDALVALAGRLPEPRKASLSLLRHPVSQDDLDRALLLWMPGQATATGEDLAELHCHGGRAVVAAVLKALASVEGLRAAEAGEFTRRAFENGRIDLNEAEGLADLLSAETERQRRSAMRMADGYFSRRIEVWRERLLGLSGLTEACLDFADEDDVPDAGAEPRLATGLSEFAAELQSELDRPSAEKLRDGISVVIAGPPNAGKSTLLNALAERDAAIVSNIPGTTRDRIEVPVAIDGIAFVITDTAGLRRADDPVEAIGVDRAKEAMAAADMLLWLSEEEAGRPDAIRVSTKSDIRIGEKPAAGTIAVSALTGEGMDALRSRLISQAKALIPNEDGYALHSRQREIISKLAMEIERAAGESDLLLVAENLRLARGLIDSLTGRAGTEDMLDALFGRFCIGK